MGARFWGVLEGGLGQGSRCSPLPGVTCEVCKIRCSASGSLAGPGIQPLVVGRQETPRLGRGTQDLCVPLNKHPPNHCLSSFWPVDFLRNFFSQTLGLGTQKERLLDELTLEGVSRYMQSERCEFPAPLGPLLHDSTPHPQHTSCDFSAPNHSQLTSASGKKPNSNWLVPKRECVDPVTVDPEVWLDSATSVLSHFLALLCIGSSWQL